MERLNQLEQLIPVYNERLAKATNPDTITILLRSYVKFQNEIIEIKNKQIENLKRQIK